MSGSTAFPQSRSRAIRLPSGRWPEDAVPLPPWELGSQAPTDQDASQALTLHRRHVAFLTEQHQNDRYQEEASSYAECDPGVEFVDVTNDGTEHPSSRAIDWPRLLVQIEPDFGVFRILGARGQSLQNQCQCHRQGK